VVGEAWLCSVATSGGFTRFRQAAATPFNFALEALIRKAAPRSREALWQPTGDIVQDFRPTQCANFLANAGYGRSS